MLHDLTHHMTETIRGMKVEVKIKAPIAANVRPLIERMAETFAWARKDPNQFNLPLDKDTTE